MAQESSPQDTFRPHLGAPSVAFRQVAALNNALWHAFLPGADFPYQAGSGYGDMNDAIVPAPKGHYATNLYLGYGGTRAQTAQKNRGMAAWQIALRKWWQGE